MKNDLDAALLLAGVLPDVVPEPALDANLAPFCQVIGTELCLLIPRDDAEEVCFVVLARTVDREPERGELLLLSELAQLDVTRQVAGQNDRVHDIRLLVVGQGNVAAELSRVCVESGYIVCRPGVWRSLVARSVRVGEVPSSNLGTPIPAGGTSVFPAAPLSLSGKGIVVGAHAIAI